MPALGIGTLIFQISKQDLKQPSNLKRKFAKNFFEISRSSDCPFHKKKLLSHKWDISKRDLGRSLGGQIFPYRPQQGKNGGKQPHS